MNSYYNGFYSYYVNMNSYYNGFQWFLQLLRKYEYFLLMLYTHTKVWPLQLDDPEDAVAQLTAMTERFKIFRFANPLPMGERLADFPSCGKCFAKFVLGEEATWQFETACINKFLNRA